jgi:hypothetical protein
LGSRNSWLHILRFRALYLQVTVWKKGNDFALHSPGENLIADPSLPCYDLKNDVWDVCPGAGNWKIVQLTAVVIPDSALPIEIVGTLPGPGGSLNPFTPELFG